MKELKIGCGKATGSRVSEEAKEEVSKDQPLDRLP